MCWFKNNSPLHVDTYLTQITLSLSCIPPRWYIAGSISTKHIETIPPVVVTKESRPFPTRTWPPLAGRRGARVMLNDRYLHDEREYRTVGWIAWFGNCLWWFPSWYITVIRCVYTTLYREHAVIHLLLLTASGGKWSARRRQPLSCRARIRLPPVACFVVPLFQIAIRNEIRLWKCFFRRIFCCPWNASQRLVALVSTRRYSPVVVYTASFPRILQDGISATSVERRGGVTRYSIAMGLAKREFPLGLQNTFAIRLLIEFMRLCPRWWPKRRKIIEKTQKIARHTWSVCSCIPSIFFSTRKKIRNLKKPC